MVQPDAGLSVTNTDTYAVPLGLGSIATYCKQKHPEIDILLIGAYTDMPHEEQMKKILEYNPDILAISSTISSQENAYDIAKKAKEQNKNIIIVFGGVNSTSLYEQILKNRDFVDAIILFDGEEAFAEVVDRVKKNKSFEGINNLAYKDKKGLHIDKNKITIKIPSLCKILDKNPPIDYSVFDMNTFLKKTEMRGFGRAISYFGGKGCIKRRGFFKEKIYTLKEYEDLVNNMGACSFCGRNELGYRILPWSLEKELINYLYEKYGVRGLFNVQDVVSLDEEQGDPKWKNTWFRFFIMAGQVTQKNIDILKKKYSPNLVLQIGVESVDPNMLKEFGKSPEFTREYYLKNLDLMEKNGIQAHYTFVLGGSNETRESLKKTGDFIKEIVKRKNVTWIGASPLIVLPGSPYFRMLSEKEKKLKDKDLFDVSELHRLFLRHFAPKITREDVLNIIKDCFSYAKLIRSDLILDGKGLTKEEEKFVGSYRPYTHKEGSWTFNFVQNKKN